MGQRLKVAARALTGAVGIDRCFFSGALSVSSDPLSASSAQQLGCRRLRGPAVCAASAFAAVCANTSDRVNDAPSAELTSCFFAGPLALSSGS